MTNIIISNPNLIPIKNRKVEIVERKGLGHPDYMTDNIMEEFSRNLCKYYLKKFGTILHHNVDKGDIVGGETAPEFGGGKVIEKILIFFSGRATTKVENEEVPIKEIAINSAKDWIKRNFRFLDPEIHIRYQVETKSGSADLKDIFARKSRIPEANDTSLGQGYAPLSETEKLVFEVEREINSKNFKNKFPFSGEDVKIMGFRNNDNLKITIACSFIDKHVESVDDYFKKKEEMVHEINEFVKNKTNLKTDIYLNTLDRKDRGKAGLYLTVTGTSAEMGDDGQVGRGNRVNGVVSYMRPVSMEAAAGKNPVSHVGKIYNILSYKIAKKIYENQPQIDEVYVQLLSQIGKPINEPLVANVDVISKKEYDEKEIKEIVENELNNIQKLTKDIVDGKIPIA